MFMIECVQGGGNVSHFNLATADKGADKSFDEYRKYMPYEPSQEISTSKASFKQEQNGKYSLCIPMLKINRPQ